MRVRVQTERLEQGDLHQDLMDAIVGPLGPRDRAVVAALATAIDRALSEHLDRDMAITPVLRAYMHEVACEIARYAPSVQPASLGDALNAILEHHSSAALAA